MTSFVELAPLISTITRGFTSPDELSTIGRIRGAQSDLSSAHMAQQAELKTIIAKYQKSVDKIDENLSAYQAKEAKLAAAVAEAQATLDNVSSSADSTSQQLVAAEEKLASLQAELARTQAQVDKATKAEAPKAPAKVAHELSLYLTITAVKFDYSKGALDSDQVVGYVCSPNESVPVKPFQFDLKDTSDFDLTNDLWEMIG